MRSTMSSQLVYSGGYGWVPGGWYEWSNYLAVYPCPLAYTRLTRQDRATRGARHLGLLANQWRALSSQGSPQSHSLQHLRAIKIWYDYKSTVPRQLSSRNGHLDT